MTAESGAISTDNLISLAKLKNSLDMDADETSHDDKLLDIIRDASQEVIAATLPYLDADDTIAATKFFTVIQQTALTRARSHWYEFTAQLDRAEYLDRKYETKIESLIESLKTERNSRRKVIAVSTDADPADNIRLPSQTDEYIARQFG